MCVNRCGASALKLYIGNISVVEVIIQHRITVVRLLSMPRYSALATDMWQPGYRRAVTLVLVVKFMDPVHP